MPEGRCRLCDAETSLQLSHILPAFLYRWVRESSGGSHLRRGAEPNMRVQDGLKRHWLCISCEGLLSRSETSFAEKLFYPFITRRESSQFLYSEWLLHFCVSVSWRVLLFHKDETSLKNYEPDAIALINKAEATWKAFLLGQRPHPGPFQQHLIPFDAIEEVSSGISNLAPNINRYLMRTIDMDLCRGGSTIFVYSKLGRFVILGFIREDHPSDWKGTKVRARNGRIEPQQYGISKQFFEYLNRKAHLVAELQSGISPRQAAKIDQTLRANIDSYIGSDEFVAMENDIRMFGDAAFTRKHSPEEE